MTAAVNATATVALALPIGPRVAAAADRTLRGETGDAEFGDYTAALLIATAVGQVLSQAVLVPATAPISWAVSAL